ncbi:MAG: Cof-type HAD-IIB family hydrolase [Clostridiales bacterium]|nr:Cof-type HAD-IIB family hydrolase [Clostridiales bacterium]
MNHANKTAGVKHGEHSPHSSAGKDDIKLFVSDMDGTLLRADFTISPVNAAAIKKLENKGIQFVVATGRIYADAYDICRASGLNPYIISNNGACIFNQNQEQIYGRWLPINLAEKVVRFLKEHNLCHALGTSQKYYVPENWEKLIDLETERLANGGVVISGERVQFIKDEMVAQTGYEPVADLSALLREESSFYSICVLTFDPEAVAAVQAFVAAQKGLAAFFSSDHSVDIVVLDGSKDVAVAYLAALLQADWPQVAAIGDGMNDLAMLKKAGVSIAVQNARDEIKSVCGYIAREFSADGVAEAIDYILRK